MRVGDVEYEIVGGNGFGIISDRVVVGSDARSRMALTKILYLVGILEEVGGSVEIKNSKIYAYGDDSNGEWKATFRVGYVNNVINRSQRGLIGDFEGSPGVVWKITKILNHPRDKVVNFLSVARRMTNKVTAKFTLPLTNNTPLVIRGVEFTLPSGGVARISKNVRGNTLLVKRATKEELMGFYKIYAKVRKVINIAKCEECRYYVEIHPQGVLAEVGFTIGNLTIVENQGHYGYDDNLIIRNALNLTRTLPQPERPFTLNTNIVSDKAYASKFVEVFSPYASSVYYSNASDERVLNVAVSIDNHPESTLICNYDAHKNALVIRSSSGRNVRLQMVRDCLRAVTKFERIIPQTTMYEVYWKLLRYPDSSVEVYLFDDSGRPPVFVNVSPIERIVHRALIINSPTKIVERLPVSDEPDVIFLNNAILESSVRKPVRMRYSALGSPIGIESDRGLNVSTVFVG